MSKTLEEIAEAFLWAEEKILREKYGVITTTMYEAPVREALLAALTEAREGALREARDYCYRQGDERAIMRRCKSLGDEILALASRPEPEPAEHLKPILAEAEKRVDAKPEHKKSYRYKAATTPEPAPESDEIHTSPDCGGLPPHTTCWEDASGMNRYKTKDEPNE